jgi:transcriptional repressor NrdR
VVDTRPSDNDQTIRRRRECVHCGRRFTTYERVDEVFPLVIKKDGRREPYQRAKLLAGLKKACDKRPVSTLALDQALDSIERSLQELGESEIPSTRVGDTVLGKLREIDEVACLRFASVYLPIRDLGDLLDEVQRLLGTKGTTP